MKKSLLLSIAVLVNLPTLSHAYSDIKNNLTAKVDNQYTIYLVRHAEKQKIKDNPPLTLCGLQRAQQLATILSNFDIKNIYSTKYQRTLSTVQPLAEQKDLAIKHYQPDELSQLALHLTTKKENTVVVGHSNTTPQLAQLLSEQKTKELSELEYQELYQIQFVGKTKILTILKQPLDCS